jgi:YD repeat-containing protein
VNRAIALVVVAACSAPTDRPIPGASITPHLDSHRAPPACGDNVTFAGDSTPDILYRYTYDDLGRLSHVLGTFTYGPGEATIDYGWDNLGHLTHSVQVDTSLGARFEITSNYDTLGDLVDYIYDDTVPQYHDTLHYQFASLSDTGMPTRETISETGQPDFHYTLVYDARDRIALTMQDGGPTTIYTYDDDGRTTTIDTNQGQFHGVVVYDDQNRELSETWGGSDPAALATQTTYEFDGDRLVTTTYESGDAAAPHDLRPIETDTVLYDCAP